MINQTDVANGVPVIREGEERISERKDIRCEVWISTNTYLEIGVLFLTTQRLIFICSDPKDMLTFECRIDALKDPTYSKKGDYRILEGIHLGNEQSNFCRFKFSYNQTGFRSMVSILFSLYHQICFPMIKNH